jgi:hypothetical protein
MWGTTAVAATLSLGHSPPNTMIDGSVHRVGEALTADRAPSTHGLGQLVLECARRKKQVGVILSTKSVCPPVLIGVCQQVMFPSNIRV